MTRAVPMVETDCWCGIPFSMPKNYYDKCRADGSKFYCPVHGHAIVVSVSEADTQRYRAELAEQRLAEAEDRAARAKKETAAVKGKLTRARRRAAASTCPCCKRSFVQMRRHMAAKHPEYLEDNKVVAIKKVSK